MHPLVNVGRCVSLHTVIKNVEHTHRRANVRDMLSLLHLPNEGGREGGREGRGGREEGEGRGGREGGRQGGRDGRQ